MRICIAQTKSLKGRIQENIQNHLKFIERAIESKSDFIVFPELSITNYEPELASELATDIDDNIFNCFQMLSDENKISIGIGMPIQATNGINISMLIFQPNKIRTIFSKSLLHSDELPYFVKSDKQPILNIKGTKIALGICYESLQREHFVRAKENEVDFYIARVSKPERGTEKAYLHFPSLAKEFKTPILMCNSVGHCDNFFSNGLSAVWNKMGESIAQLGNKNEGLIYFDTQTANTKTDQLRIEKGQLTELDEIFQIYLDGKKELEKNGLFQWVDTYPTKSLIESDLKKEILYVLINGTKIIGAINISEEQETVYQSVNWNFDDSKVLVIHRLVIDPKHQRQGYARKLMDFAENIAERNNYTSIRLDAYSQNNRVLHFYKKRNYHICGQVNFPKREFPFHCMEKEVNLKGNLTEK